MTHRQERAFSPRNTSAKRFSGCGDELPYATAVEIEKFEVEGNLRRILPPSSLTAKAKAIVIGKGAIRLKRIASEARQDMERLSDGKVYLEVWVKVKSG